MPKIISNPPGTTFPNPNENKFPSLICNLTAAGKIIPNQLYCCSNGDCTTQFDSNNCSSSSFLSQCHNISNLDACQRKDSNAARVCEWKEDYFCLSDQNSNNPVRFSAVKWSVSRNTLAESFNLTNPIGNVISCYNGTDYQLDNGSGCGSNANLTCGDMFNKNYYCSWSLGLQTVARQPLGEVCEVFPTQTVVTTITNSSINTPLFIGLTSVTGVLGIYFLTTLIVGGLCFYRRLFSPIRV